MSFILNPLSSVVPIGGVATLTGNSGGAVGPSAGNINVVGSGNVTVTGNPGTNTLTITSSDIASISITGDTGGALTGSSFTFTGGTTGLAFGGSGSTETLSGTVNVGHGGTGNTTFTPYAVITAGTTATGVFQNVSGLGTSGYVLTSNGAGALPTWQAGGGGGGGITTIDGDSGSVTGSTITITGSTSGAVFTGSGTTLTESFNYLALPSTTSTNGQITINGSPVLQSYGTRNLFLAGAGNFTLSGVDNVGIGSGALVNLTSGDSNIAIGTNSLNAETQYSDQIAIGNGALQNAINTQQSIAIGTSALASVSGSSNHVAIGYQAGTAVVGGSDNTYIGYQCGKVCSSGGNNTIMGSQSLYTEASGSDNTGIGHFALYWQNGASYNTAVGHAAGSGITTGQYNVAIGYSAIGGPAITTGGINLAIGYEACNSLTSGTNNVGLGDSSLTALTTGTYNTAIGSGSGQGYTSSEFSNISINSAGSAGESNTLRIGSGTGTSTHQINKAIVCGIQGITVTGTAVLISSGDQLGIAVSSARFKENIADMNDYSSPILNLRPATFNYTVGEDHSLQGGLIAEEVAEVMPSLVVYDKEGLPQTVKYHDLPALLLNELQKALKRIEILESKLK